jgi:hypothetical protein
MKSPPEFSLMVDAKGLEPRPASEAKSLPDADLVDCYKIRTSRKKHSEEHGGSEIHVL